MSTPTLYCLVLLTELFSPCFRLCPSQRHCILQSLLSVHLLPRIPCCLLCYSLRSLLLKSRLLVNCCHCRTYRYLSTQCRKMYTDMPELVHGWQFSLELIFFLASLLPKLHSIWVTLNCKRLYGNYEITNTS